MLDIARSIVDHLSSADRAELTRYIAELEGAPIPPPPLGSYSAALLGRRPSSAPSDRAPGPPQRPPRELIDLRAKNTELQKKLSAANERCTAAQAELSKVIKYVPHLFTHVQDEVDVPSQKAKGAYTKQKVRLLVPTAIAYALKAIEYKYVAYAGSCLIFGSKSHVTALALGTDKEERVCRDGFIRVLAGDYHLGMALLASQLPVRGQRLQDALDSANRLQPADKRKRKVNIPIRVGSLIADLNQGAGAIKLLPDFKTSGKFADFITDFPEDTTRNIPPRSVESVKIIDDLKKQPKDRPELIFGYSFKTQGDGSVVLDRDREVPDKPFEDHLFEESEG